MAKGKKKTTLWVVLAAVILAIFALGKLGGSEPGTTARQTTAAVTETTAQATDTTTEKQTADSAKAKTAAKKKQTAANVPAFSGKPYVVLDDNQPRFSAKDKKRRSAYESYAPLDSLGRCGVAFACLCKETMPTEKRGEIGQVRPSGWHTVKYDTVDGKYLYNRCHLIGYQLSAENANTRNLITGTRYLNTQGMLPFENLVADYIKETGNHVLYRVTPIFSGNDLVAKGGGDGGLVRGGRRRRCVLPCVLLQQPAGNPNRLRHRRQSHHRRPYRHHSLSEIQLINTPSGAVAAAWGVVLIDSTI